jgi:hypothetical protein
MGNHQQKVWIFELVLLCFFFLSGVAVAMSRVLVIDKSDFGAPVDVSGSVLKDGHSMFEAAMVYEVKSKIGLNQVQEVTGFVCSAQSATSLYESMVGVDSQDKVVSRGCTCQTRTSKMACGTFHFFIQKHAKLPIPRLSLSLPSLSLSHLSYLPPTVVRIICKHNVALYYAFRVLQGDYRPSLQFKRRYDFRVRLASGLDGTPPPKRWEEVIEQAKQPAPLSYELILGKQTRFVKHTFAGIKAAAEADERKRASDQEEKRKKEEEKKKQEEEKQKKKEEAKKKREDEKKKKAEERANAAEKRLQKVSKRQKNDGGTSTTVLNATTETLSNSHRPTKAPAARKPNKTNKQSNSPNNPSSAPITSPPSLLMTGKRTRKSKELIDV